jgi:hypothetical protein
MFLLHWLVCYAAVEHVAGMENWHFGVENGRFELGECNAITDVKGVWGTRGAFFGVGKLVEFEERTSVN